MGIKCMLYKLAVWYIGRCNKKWDRSAEGLDTLEKLTYRNGDKSYLRYGMDAEWKNFSRYDVIDNAIQKLAEYENGTVEQQRSMYEI